MTGSQPHRNPSYHLRIDLGRVFWHQTSIELQCCLLIRHDQDSASVRALFVLSPTEPEYYTIIKTFIGDLFPYLSVT